MCGIVGIYLKTKKFEKNLGKMLSGMLNNMESRGPDSAGFAIYKNEKKDIFKYSLCINDLNFKKFKKEISNKKIGRAHVRTPVTSLSRMPSSA